MDGRLALAEHLKGSTAKKRCLIGWDGVTDELLEVVDTRASASAYQPIKTQEALGKRILAAAGKSCNLELVTKEVKLGGNGPIFANALVRSGQEVTFAGNIGEGVVEPVFQEFASGCQEVILLGKSAYTQALEFSDGKVMLGKLAHFNAITWDRVLKAKGIEGWIKLIDSIDLLGSVNWTMLYEVENIWKGLLDLVLPKVSKRKRWMYVDLSDPKKRGPADLKRGMELLSRFAHHFQVVLGLNDSERGQVSKALGVEDLSEAVREKLGLYGIACHASHHAEFATEEGKAEYAVPATSRPKVITGAGDNFNGGFCLGLLEERSPMETLLSGIGTASSYVRTGKSPTRSELAQFLVLWHGNAISM